MILVGTYYHQLDERGRFRVPVKFKKDFEVRNEQGEILPPLVMRGTNECLFMYPSGTAEKLFEKFSEVDFTSEAANDDVRNFTCSAVWAERDQYGRVSLNDDLIEYAGLEKDIVSVGVYNHVEIWSEKNWKAYLARQAAAKGGAAGKKEQS